MQAFSKFTVNEAMSEPELKHRVSVTVSDPQHTMVSKRKDKVEKRVRITAKDDKHAEELAKHHFKKQGYKVHDVNYIGVTEATVNTADIEKKKLITPADKRTIGKVADLMARERALKAAKPVKEQKDQVDELTNKAIVNYVVKAGKEADKLKKHIATGGEYQDIAKNVLARRQKGLNKATNKLAHRAMMKDYEDSSKAGRLTDEVNMEEAVTVKKQNYSWGKMVTVHDGSKTSYPLHPEHQKELSKLRDGDKTSFKDETGRRVHAHREGDKVHLMSKEGGYKPTAVPFHHFEEQADINELKKSTISSYVKKAAGDLSYSSFKSGATHKGDEADADFSDDKDEVRARKREAGIRRAANKLAKEAVDNPPFEGGKPSPSSVKDKSGAVHTAMSRAKHLARMAAAKEKKPIQGFKKFNDK